MLGNHRYNIFKSSCVYWENHFPLENQIIEGTEQAEKASEQTIAMELSKWIVDLWGLKRWSKTLSTDATSRIWN